MRDRIVDAHSQWVFTTDEGKRGGRTLALKQTVDEALENLDFVRHVFVFKRTHTPTVIMSSPRDIDMSIEMSKHRPYCPATSMDSEDMLFILYTSGSTGKPKGVVHTTAGYLLYSMLTSKYVFDLHEDDVFACVADCGWITGHSYIVYGPLANGATTVMFESTPVYPDAGRYWDLVARHHVSQFYTAPTAIRALMAHGEGPVKQHDRSSLRILGTVGEPINPEAWKWYYEVVGDRRCAIVDTYWQTETGMNILVNILVNISEYLNIRGTRGHRPSGRDSDEAWIVLASVFRHHVSTAGRKSAGTHGAECRRAIVPRGSLAGYGANGIWRS